MKKSEIGSAHVVIIGGLIVALIGALGFIFWQNIINKPKMADTNTSASSPQPSKSPEVVLKTLCTPKEKICFDYPSNWSAQLAELDVDTGSVAERVVISDDSGKQWLRLRTGMSGLGGACGDDGKSDGSYSKVLQTHTTAVTGSYLVSAYEGASNMESDTAYAVSRLDYSGIAKTWTIKMELNHAKASQTIATIGPCDATFYNILNGKNAAWSTTSKEPGSVIFNYYTGSDTAEKYSTEAAAAAIIQSANGKKAYAILQSAHYQ